jgi:DtxR family transcriptional regulator, Mn-dependent transcriptional regulator
MFGKPYYVNQDEHYKGKVMTLSASLEDYLEAIYQIADTKQVARAKDISARLKVNYSSVTGALRALSERRLVNYAPYDLITLTPEGRVAARDVVRRHEALCDFFVKVLAIDQETANIGACKMEHEVPPAIIERFIQFVDFVETCPQAGVHWFKNFGYTCQNPGQGDRENRCKQCLKRCQEQTQLQAEPSKKKIVMTLNQLQVGQRAKLIKVGGRGELRKRLIDMGMAPGAVVGVERVAPLGDPIDIKLRGYHLSLRKDEASLVSVEFMEEDKAQ